VNLSLRQELSDGRSGTVSLLAGASLRMTRLEEICFTDVIDKDFLETKGFRLSNKPPVIAPYRSWFLVLDGNHRCAYDLLFRKQEMIECAIWTTDPRVIVVKCKSLLFEEVIDFGIERAVRAQQSVMVGTESLSPGCVVYK